MISPRSRRLFTCLKCLRPLLCTANLKVSRKGQDAIGFFAARTLRKRIAYTPEPFDHFQAEWALPLCEPREGVILYLHGGGYVMGTMAYARAFGGAIAEKTARITLCIAYRLAPENSFPAALDDALDAYLCLRERYPSQPVALVGESAGGGLCFALAGRLRTLNLPAPECIVTFSPWTDLTCSGASFQAQAAQDPCLSPKLVRRAARWYAGDDTANPLVSPLFADLSGMPPALIYAGSREILCDDAVQMATRYRQAGSSCRLHIAQDMWHGYPLYATPESDQAFAGTNSFLNSYLSTAQST